MIWLLIIIITMIILTYPPLVTVDGLEQHPLWGIFYSIPAFYAMPFILFHLSNEYDSKLLMIIAILQIIINIGIIVYGYSKHLWISILFVMALNIVTFIARISITLLFLYFSYKILFWIPKYNQTLSVFIKEQFASEIVEIASELNNKNKTEIIESELNTETSTNLVQTETILESKLNISQDWSKNGNIINGGHAVYDGTSYYIGDSSLYELNTGGQKKILLNKQVDYINESGNYLYFVINNENKICRMCKDGTNLTKLSEYQVHELTLYNDVLYFVMIAEGESNKICRMNTDGSGFSELYYSSNEIWYMNVYQSSVYFTDLNENRNIKCMNTDGSNVRTINSSKCYDVIIVNNMIYYSENKDNRYLHRMDLNGNNQTQLNSSDTRNLNYCDGYLYYRDGNYNMHRCRLDGENDSIICNNGDVTFITLVPDKIYYRQKGKESGLKEITVLNIDDSTTAPQKNKRFEVYADAITWEEARQKCIEKGGHLAYITCQDDYDTILLKLSSAELRYLWVGATTTISENDVYASWLDGTSLDFINNNRLWYPGEPSGRDVTSNEKNIEPYIMLWNIKGEWSFNDNSNISLETYKKKYFGYICEFEE